MKAMANESLANGTITLNGNWTKDMIEMINKDLEAKAEWRFNISTDGFKYGEKCTDFDAVGRWAFKVNLEMENYWNDIDPLLLRLMKKNNASLTFDYVDEEPGNEVLAKAKITLSSNGNCLIITDEKYKEYDFTVENRMSLGFEWAADEDNDDYTAVNNASECSTKCWWVYKAPGGMKQ